jgi:hypothetical protein
MENPKMVAGDGEWSEGFDTVKSLKQLPPAIKGESGPTGSIESFRRTRGDNPHHCSGVFRRMHSALANPYFSYNP